MTTTLLEESSRTDRQARTLSRERRAELLAEFERSPLSARAFAERVGVRHSTFAGWIQRHRSKTRPLGSGAPPEPTPVRWIEAVVDRAAESPQTDQPLVVKLGAEMVVEVSCRAHLELVAELAGLLARARRDTLGDAAC
jgi:transposase-like protein